MVYWVGDYEWPGSNPLRKIAMRSVFRMYRRGMEANPIGLTLNSVRRYF